MSDIQRFEKISRRDYPYVIVDGVRTAPPVGEGLRVSLSYIEMDVEDALAFVKENHPNVKIIGVTNYV